MSISAVAATGAECTVSEIFARDENASRKLTEIWVRDENNTPRQVWGGAAGGGTEPLTATASPDEVYGAGSNKAPRPITTNETTVAVAGGVEPYTYQWSARTNWTATAPNEATTAFRASPGAGQTLLASFACTVTDKTGAVVMSNSVAAQVENYGG